MEKATMVEYAQKTPKIFGGCAPEPLPSSFGSAALYVTKLVLPAKLHHPINIKLDPCLLS